MSQPPIEKVAASDVKFQILTESFWKGTQLAEVFGSDGRRKMSCGVHEITAS